MATSTVNIAETAFLTQNLKPWFFVANLTAYLLKEKASHLKQYWTSYGSSKSYYHTPTSFKYEADEK